VCHRLYGRQVSTFRSNFHHNLQGSIITWRIQHVLPKRRELATLLPGVTPHKAVGNIQRYVLCVGDRRGTVVKVLCYKSEGRWFDSSWCHWHKILPIALWPWGRRSLLQKWVPETFPGGKGGRCVRLTTLPPSCAVVMKSGNLKFLEPSGPLQACNGTAVPFLRSLYVHHRSLPWRHSESVNLNHCAISSLMLGEGLINIISFASSIITNPNSEQKA